MMSRVVAAASQRIAGIVVAGLLLSQQVMADPFVRVSTTYGDFTLELLDEAAPATVQNFLNYVNRRDYNGTFIHRLDAGFVFQGGAFRFQPFVGLINVPQDPPVVNEFNISNTRGTVAMAKLPSDPNSATSQWFVNLGDNSANLDNQNGGFTAFARVMGDGMSVADQIGAQPVFNLGSLTPTLPLRGDTSGGVSSALDVKANNFITLSMVQTQRFTEAMHVFESANGLLMTTVEGGVEGRFSLNMRLIATEPEILFEVNRDTMVPLAINPEGAAIFSNEDNRLRIPVVELNMGGNISQIRNVVLVLTEVENLRFKLESYEE
ncbi:MAG: peptidylprolyl isomerase [Pseudomonadales bacterium]|nr:peptidylprolyl isomerase [Pseudomonadales bacterium]